MSMLSNYFKFGDYVDRIYPMELDIGKDIMHRARSAS